MWYAVCCKELIQFYPLQLLVMYVWKELLLLLIFLSKISIYFTERFDFTPFNCQVTTLRKLFMHAFASVAEQYNVVLAKCSDALHLGS